MTRRLLAAALAATALLVAGCGSGDETGGAAPATSKMEKLSDGTAFPSSVTVAHKYGSTTIKDKPERIVVAGLTEQDTLLALGVKPIAVTEWYGDQPYATWPWARDRLGDAKPTVLKTDDGFEYERIAALRPDLILAVNAGLKPADYKKMSKIAPTIGPGQESNDYFTPWDTQTYLVAAALGRVDDGEALVRNVKRRYADAAKAHPEFAGKTVTFAQNAFYSGMLYAYQDGLNTEFLTMLGLTVNPKLTPLVKNDGEQVGVSSEKLGVLDADALVFATEKPEDITNLQKVPTFSQLDGVAKNRAVYTDATLSGAMYFMTPLSLDYVVEQLPPLLVKALEGKSPREMQPGT